VACSRWTTTCQHTPERFSAVQQQRGVHPPPVEEVAEVVVVLLQQLQPIRPPPSLTRGRRGSAASLTWSGGPCGWQRCLHRLAWHGTKQVLSRWGAEVRLPIGQSVSRA
jgi:hypothetical protein